MLPDGDGIELCKIVKIGSSRTAVVIISARDDKRIWNWSIKIWCWWFY